MKLAKVRYTGPMRSHMRKGVEGKLYKFSKPTGTESRWVPVENIDDALEFANQDVFDVEWTPQGEIARRVGRQVSSARDALTELSYRQKQRLTTSLGLEVAGNSKEEELDDALQPAVEEMVNNLTQGR